MTLPVASGSPGARSAQPYRPLGCLSCPWGCPCHLLPWGDRWCDNKSWGLVPA